MTIEIRELIIRTIVAEREEENIKNNELDTQYLKKQILNECIRKIEKMIEKRRER